MRGDRRPERAAGAARRQRGLELVLERAQLARLSRPAAA